MGTFPVYQQPISKAVGTIPVYQQPISNWCSAIASSETFGTKKKRTKKHNRKQKNWLIHETHTWDKIEKNLTCFHPCFSSHLRNKENSKKKDSSLYVHLHSFTRRRSGPSCSKHRKRWSASTAIETQTIRQATGSCSGCCLTSPPRGRGCGIEGLKKVKWFYKSMGRGISAKRKWSEYLVCFYFFCQFVNISKKLKALLLGKINAIEWNLWGKPIEKNNK